MAGKLRLVYMQLCVAVATRMHWMVLMGMLHRHMLHVHEWDHALHAPGSTTSRGA